MPTRGQERKVEKNIFLLTELTAYKRRNRLKLYFFSAFANSALFLS